MGYIYYFSFIQLRSGSDHVELLNKIFPENSNHDNSGNSLLVFTSGTSLAINILKTSIMVENTIHNRFRSVENI